MEGQEQQKVDFEPASRRFASRVRLSLAAVSVPVSNMSTEAIRATQAPRGLWPTAGAAMTDRGRLGKVKPLARAANCRLAVLQKDTFYVAANH